jgi:hypothetical protein
VRTELYNNSTDFETWWYAKDPAHVNFFKMETMHAVAEKLCRNIIYTNGKNVVIFGGARQA